MKRIMKPRIISKKAEKEWYRLVRETRSICETEGTNWSWANSYMKNETRNLIEDLVYLAKKQRRNDEKCLEIGIECFLPLEVHDIIIKYIEDRLGTYKETEYGFSELI